MARSRGTVKESVPDLATSRAAENPPLLARRERGQWARVPVVH